MGAVDFILFTLLAFGETALMIHLYRRRARRVRSERMMRSLRAAIERETGAQVVRVEAACPALVLQSAG
jgi:hypothetical protein